MNELKPCPMCGGAPNKPAKNGGSDERSGYNFTITVACKCGLRIDRASHQGKQGWCDDSGQAEAEAIAAWNRRAQPAAPAILMSAVFVKEGADDFAPQRLLPCGSAVYLVPPDAAPSVAPEPVAWEGGEGWESLAWELCADENGEDACNELIWEGGPIPEPWGDRWMKYEGEAKRLIALVHKHAAHPPRAPLTDEHVTAVVRSVCPNLAETSKAWRDLVVECRYWLEAAHGIGGK
jgi:hypothetical protein